MKPVIDRTETVYQGFARYLVATLRLPDGSTIRREIEDHGDGAAVLPYDPDRRVALLVRQVRPPPLFKHGVESLLEAPAGLMDGEEPEACARREVMEEVGVRVAELEHVYTAWSSPGVSTERLHGFLGRYASADRVDAGGGLASENEVITVVEMPLAALAALADEGGIADLKTLVLLQALRLRHPGLFVSAP